MIGTTVGKYRVVEKLGRGGMGTVYKAVDETLDREVAIKVLNPDLTDQAVLKRFRAEAVTLARLNHPSIATIYELHQHGDDLLMVMEFVRGETFHDLSDRLGPLAPPQAAHLCMQVLDALGHAHRAGVVHRDLKPANVMITESGAVKVMDFGIARVLGSEHFTHGGYMMGTPAYMAPEQVLGREIDGRADLYSVGVVLYRLLSGRLPFDADTAISMVQMQISEPPTPIASFRPDLPQWCIAIVERALAKAPADRFQSAEEFRAALLVAAKPQTLGEMPTLATPTPPGLAIESDATVAQRTPTSGRVPTGSMPPGTPQGQPVDTIATAVVPQVTTTPPPTPRSTERTTTTVVLNRTHLMAMAALLVIGGVGIAILIIVALRGPSLPQQIAANTPAGATGQPAADTSAPSSSAPTPPAASNPATPTPAPTSTSPATPGAKPTATPGAPPPVAGAPPPVAGAPAPGAATAGATTAAGRGTTPPTPTDPAAAARGGRASNPKDAVASSSTTAVPATSVTSPPSVSFNQVRVLIAEAGKAREREGVLQLGDGNVSMLSQAGGAAILTVPNSSLSGLVYARSKQPKWRDASGKEVESRIDLGPMGFLRGERNWIILLRQGEPVILRIEDAALRTVLPAISERTGLKIQRYTDQ
jgi:eukaryotic-like serine/threonine-protein kinase